MLQLHKHMFALGCLIVVAVAPTQSDQPKKPEPSRTDCYGDALPLGAITRLGTVRFRHSNTVSCFVFSNDGKLLVSGGEDQTIRVWDVASGRELQRCSGNQGHVHSLMLTPDTTTIV